MSDMTLADALEKVQEWIGELVEVLDPSVTIQRLDEPVKASTASTAPTTPCPATLGSNKCSRPAGHCGDHANAEMFWTDSEPTPKWREMVDQQSTFADTFAGQPLAAVLYNMYLCTEDYFLLDRLAHIVTVCEQQVPGWKAEPYESNDFSTFQLVSAFGSVLRNPAEPALRDWQALGEEAASWLKHLTEADDTRTGEMGND